MIKIKFKKIDSDLNEVFLGDLHLGTVERNIWNQKWTMKPKFKFSKKLQRYLHEEYDSFYRAGKKMVELYNRAQEKPKVNIDKGEYDPWDDTQEMDMRSIFDALTP